MELQFNDLVRKGGSRFHTNNVALILTLSPTSEAGAAMGGSNVGKSAPLYVGCAHLFHDPNQMDVKVLQSQMLMQVTVQDRIDLPLTLP